jgi:hypothetical protein
MNILDHGKWVPYEPAQPPKEHPANVLYLKRESDAADWYVYSHDHSKFNESTVKFMAMYQAAYGGYVIGPAVTDVSMLFPRNQVVAEVYGYTGNDPQADFGHKLYDPATGAVTTYVPPDPGPTIFERLADLDARVAALEKTKK